NDTVFVECAQALGRRLALDRPQDGPRERARHGFRLCVGREPTERELAVLVKLFDDLLAQAKANPAAAAKLAGSAGAGMSVPEAAAYAALARALLNLDEFVTRE